MTLKCEPHRNEVIVKREPEELAIWKEKRIRKSDDKLVSESFYVEVSMRNRPGMKPVRPMLSGQAPNLTQARVLRDQLRHKLREQVIGKSCTFREFYDREFVEEINATRVPQAAYNIRCCFEAHLLPALGDKVLSDITSSDLNNVIYEVLKNRSGSTQANYVKWLKKFFGMARDQSLIDRNPAERMRKPADTKPKEKGYLTIEQLRTLLGFMKANSHPYFLHFLLAAETGLRVNEQKGLVWGAVDFEKGMIRVSRTFDRKNGFKYNTKDYEHRWVPLPENLRAELLKRKQNTNPTPEDFVLPQERKWVTGEIGDILHDLCALLGLPKCRYYDLRSSYAMALATKEKPATLLEISQVLGHSDLAVTSEYMRKLGAHLRHCAEGLDLL